MNTQKKEVLDTTLRDGEQSPGITFSLTERERIARGLIDAGVDEIEAGFPAMGGEWLTFITQLVKDKPPCRISAWARLRKDDLEAAHRAGVSIVHISMPVSDYHLPLQTGTWEKTRQRLLSLLRYGKDHFQEISLGLQDSFRSPPERLEEAVAVARDFNVFRIRFSDTVGNALPRQVGSVISRFRKLFPRQIDFHGHNDMGLAGANSLAALEAGADSVNVTVNGMGERAGNACLAEMAIILQEHPDFATTLDMEKIKALSLLTAGFIHRPIPVDKPVVGELVFTHESGIHCHGLRGNPLAYQPFDPEERGLGRAAFVAGSHSGRAGIKVLLGQGGYTVSDEEISQILEKIKKRSLQKKNFLSFPEVLEILKDQSGKEYGIG